MARAWNHFYILCHLLYLKYLLTLFWRTVSTGSAREVLSCGQKGEEFVHYTHLTTHLGACRVRSRTWSWYTSESLQQSIVPSAWFALYFCRWKDLSAWGYLNYSAMHHVCWSWSHDVIIKCPKIATKKTYAVKKTSLICRCIFMLYSWHVLTALW